MKLNGFRPRIMGTETEYAIDGSRGEEFLCADQVLRYLRQVIFLSSRISRQAWLENGANYYTDIGSHPEFCTPECRSGIEAALHERVGEEFYLDAFARLSSACPSLSFRLVKTNRDEQGNRWGYHQNYLISSELDNQHYGYLFPLLSAYLVSRQLWAGAGWVQQLDTGQSRYRLGQRAWHASDNLSDRADRAIGVMDLRQEPLAGAGFRRLHHTLDDSNMLWIPSWLKLADMDLLLLMTENRALEPVTLLSPYRAAKQLSLGLSERVSLDNGDSISALDIQQHYFLHQEQFVARHDLVAFKPLLDQKRFILTSLQDGAYEKLIGVVDHITARAIIERKGPIQHQPYRRCQEIDLQYRQPGSKLGRWVRSKWDPSWVAGAVRRARFCPPRTRARARASLLAQFGPELYIEWRYAIASDSCSLSFRMDDPFQTQLPTPREVSRRRTDEYAEFFLQRALQD